jgi:hypothetical protein
MRRVDDALEQRRRQLRGTTRSSRARRARVLARLSSGLSAAPLTAMGRVRFRLVALNESALSKNCCEATSISRSSGTARCPTLAKELAHEPLSDLVFALHAAGS